MTLQFRCSEAVSQSAISPNIKSGIRAISGFPGD